MESENRTWWLAIFAIFSLAIFVLLLYLMPTPQSCGGRQEGVYEFKVGNLKSGETLYKIEVYDSHQCLKHEKYYTKDSEGFYIDM